LIENNYQFFFNKKMAKSLIIFGIIGKKIYLTFILASILISLSITKILIPQVEHISLINSLGGSLLDILSVFIPYIFKLKSRSNSVKIKRTKNIFKDYGIFLLIYLLYFGINYLIEYLDIQDVDLGTTDIGVCIQMICYNLLSPIILKSKYYIHHIISIILFCIFSIISDSFLQYFKDIGFGSILLILPHTIKNLFSVYWKYLIDKKYHSYWNILFFYGLYSFIIQFIQFIIIIIKDPYDNSIFKSIRNAEKKYIVINFLLEAIIGNNLRLLISLLILQYFSLNHVLISFTLYYIVIYTFICAYSYNEYKYNLYFLIPAVFQIISLLFFLEILEFNFCGLNKNTKRNIMLREEAEMQFRNSISSDIEIDNDLTINIPQDKDIIELYDPEEKDDDTYYKEN